MKFNLFFHGKIGYVRLDKVPEKLPSQKFRALTPPTAPLKEIRALLRCPRKLGSMVSKWVISPTYKWGLLGL